MKQAVSFVSSVSRFTIAVGLIVLMVSLFNWYQVRTAENAASFEPVNAKSLLVPERTVIDAVIRNGVTESAAVGDAIIASVNTPVSIKDNTIIASVAHLRSSLEGLSVGSENARLTVHFHILSIEDPNC